MLHSTQTIDMDNRSRLMSNASSVGNTIGGGKAPSIDLGAMAQSGQAYMAARPKRSWRRYVYMFLAAVYLLLLGVGAVMSIAIVVKMTPALKVANSAMGKIDIMYGALAQAVRVVCALPDNGIPAELLPLLCSSTSAFGGGGAAAP